MVGRSGLGLQMDPQPKEVCQDSLIPMNPESNRGLQDWLGSLSEAGSVASKRYIMECGAKSPVLHLHYIPLKSRRGTDGC